MQSRELAWAELVAGLTASRDPPHPSENWKTVSRMRLQMYVTNIHYARATAISTNIRSCVKQLSIVLRWLYSVCKFQHNLIYCSIPLQLQSLFISGWTGSMQNRTGEAKRPISGKAGGEASIHDGEMKASRAKQALMKVCEWFLTLAYIGYIVGKTWCSYIMLYSNACNHVWIDSVAA